MNIKKYINRKLNIKLLLISGILLTSCNDDDFLDLDPETFYTIDNVFSTGVQVEQSLITLYDYDRTLRTSTSFNGIIQGKGTDVMVTPGFRSGLHFSDYSSINAENSYLRNLFNYHYSIIASANTTISAADIDGIEFESEETKAYVLAQARFFRAKIHGQLAQLFGNVGIVDESASEPRYDYEQSTRAEVYQFAIDELEAILDDLPETAAEPGKVVKGAAQHYLSEFYLSLGTETGDSDDFDKSIEYATDLIDGGVYSLMTDRFGSRIEEEGKDVYWDLFRKGNINYSDGNNESIWAYQMDYDAYVAGDENAATEYPRYWGPVWRQIAGVDGTAEDVGGRGVAYYTPTDLSETIIWEDAVSAGDLRNSEANITRTIYYNDPADEYAEVYGTVVPQEAIDQAKSELEGAIYPIFQRFTTDQFEGLDNGEDRSNLFIDRYAIRLSETILVRAEAHFRKGETQLAADDINIIRNRAQCDVLATAGTVDIDYILDERARELLGEESRWNTLLRMGGTVAVDRIRTYAEHDWTTNSLTFDFNAFPIPQLFIDANSEVRWEQNEGW
ncbi:RagB/SusD family nutrient uptake outer membrane protein [Cellulophaga baltica]|uniref:RagB/SusD family nutrient uptake outer membrane protein n=1 Tax=Cellulophaga TaxID=104264 RepID=UPI001C0759E0|nr:MULTISPECIES: RagB/SusD family nutrient uptake outer membrane protein [Cellulophaga]MBU2996679.1 RagB/SusD family nutrient uptake outer membrane protein [Cellulophaga baltica]MDO6768073.1 RagB/SusD family nutrient uptake outer membrane protein [Cellulophaga sp. 1_MG-2023]